MKKVYESPEVEIEKYTIACAVTTSSWGEGGDEYDDFADDESF